MLRYVERFVRHWQAMKKKGRKTAAKHAARKAECLVCRHLRIRERYGRRIDFSSSLPVGGQSEFQRPLVVDFMESVRDHPEARDGAHRYARDRVFRLRDSGTPATQRTYTDQSNWG